jgi:hypothetical protein
MRDEIKIAIDRWENEGGQSAPALGSISAGPYQSGDTIREAGEGKRRLRQTGHPNEKQPRSRRCPAG